MDEQTRTQVGVAAGVAAVLLLAVVVWMVTDRGAGPSRPASGAGEGTAAATSDTAALTGPVMVRGRVVDDASGEGIPRAIIIVLQPGVTSRGWMEARGAEATAALMQATVVTDSMGVYEIADLERGRSYTVMVTAEGYAPAVFEEGLEITRRDFPITTMRDVVLGAR